MIAHHPRQNSGEPVKRPRPDAANESKSRKRAEVGKPCRNRVFDKIRFVCFACAGLRLWVVKAAISQALYRLSDMAIVAGRRRWDGGHDVATVNQAERRGAE